MRFSVSLDALAGEAGSFELGTDWQEYTAEFTASEKAGGRTGMSVRLDGPGTAWFDALQVVPVE